MAHVDEKTPPRLLLQWPKIFRRVLLIFFQNVALIIKFALNIIIFIYYLTTFEIFCSVNNYINLLQIFSGLKSPPGPDEDK